MCIIAVTLQNLRCDFTDPSRNRCGKRETHLLLPLLKPPTAEAVLKCHLALSPSVSVSHLFASQVWRVSVFIMDLAQDVICLQSTLESKPADLWVFSWPLKSILNLTEDDLRKKWGVNRLLTHCQSCLLLSTIGIIPVFQLEMKAIWAERMSADWCKERFR